LPVQPDQPLPDEDHVLRYIAPAHIDNGRINGAGFLRRRHEQASSVNWLEYFPAPIENQIAEIRARRRLHYAKTGLLARVNVGATRRHLSLNAQVELGFIYKPLPEDREKGFSADPSHAEIYGIPMRDGPQTELIEDLLAECIIKPHYPAVGVP
jgi:hypothetical protein